jgi:hypothetical protein
MLSCSSFRTPRSGDPESVLLNAMQAAVPGSVALRANSPGMASQN